jgi:hypothetical protein
MRRSTLKRRARSSPIATRGGGTGATTTGLRGNDDRDRRGAIGVDQRHVPASERGDPSRALAHGVATVLRRLVGDQEMLLPVASS